MLASPHIHVFLWLTMTYLAESLTCWKCVAHNCQMNPEGNYKATKASCFEGQECMKVRYRMFDNYTHFDSVIRTCSAEACLPTSTDDFETCLNTQKRYTRLEGCVLRSCCADKDLCNDAGRTSSFQVMQIIPLQILTLLLVFKVSEVT